MSRIGKKPIPVPDNVQVSIERNLIKVKGPKGELEFEFHPDMKVSYDSEKRIIKVERPSDEKFHRALHGTTRQIINNMIIGVEKGYEKRLEVVGTGYRARKEGNGIVLELGFSHLVKVEPLEGVTLDVEGNNKIIVRGIDKQKVGQMAAIIRSIKPPEPYKGKGIRYEGEHVRRKAGKAGVKAG